MACFLQWARIERFGLPGLLTFKPAPIDSLRRRHQLPTSILNFFLDYATPGYTQEGPTAAVYNHGWLIGNTSAISNAVQSQVDSLLEVVPQK